MASDKGYLFDMASNRFERRLFNIFFSTRAATSTCAVNAFMPAVRIRYPDDGFQQSAFTRVEVV